MNKFVIHTVNRRDRELLFKAELSNQGCSDYEIVIGNTGNNPVKQISEAHMKAVRLAKQRGLLYAVIMENDIRFTSPKSFSRFEELLTTELPSDWDLFLGGMSRGIVGLEDSPVMSITDFSGFHFYAVNQKFYDIFLGADTYTNIDRWCSRQRRYKFYCAYPILATQYSTYSDNTGKKLDSKIFGTYKQYK